MKTTAAIFAITALLLAITPAKAEDPKTYTKAEIEKIIRDYIMENPTVMMDSVDAYQKKMMEARSGAGLAQNKDKIFKDEGSPVMGNPQGDVTVVEFFDYNCHFCKVVYPMIKDLLNKDKNVRVIFKEFPILSASSETAAKWALAANKQDKYFELHGLLMQNKRPIDDSLLEDLAKQAGLDIARAKKDIEGADILAQLDKTRKLADSLGLTGTPAFVVEDEIVRGAVSLAEIESTIAKKRKNQTK